MRLYIARHGESETNVRKCWTGQLDVSLTENGLRDAKKLGERLSKLSFDKVFSSDLLRAVQTAEGALPGCAPERTELLREVDVGSLAGKPLSTPIDPGIDRHRDGYAALGGESMEELTHRVREFMSLVESSGAECIAAFSHAGVILRMLSLVLGVEFLHGSLLCRNCALAIFEISDGVWRLHSFMNLD